jgi:hypothetical protein
MNADGGANRARPPGRLLGRGSSSRCSAMERSGPRRGLPTMCVGVGQGAMLIELS